LTIHQRGRDEMHLRAGDVWFAPNDCPQQAVHSNSSRGLSITIPRASLKSRLVKVDLGRIKKLLPTAELHLFAHYAAALIRMPDTVTPATARLAATHLHDVVALVLGASGDAAHLAKRRGLSAARYQAVCADILANLAKPELSLDWIAARHAISPRYLRGLFYDQQTSFSDFTRNARLDKARDLLTDPRFAHHTITAIVHETGLGDLSGFNRMFRRRFGVTPSELRAIAQSDNG
jgi:AraC-like DNA-binding protein